MREIKRSVSFSQVIQVELRSQDISFLQDLSSSKYEWEGWWRYRVILETLLDRMIRRRRQEGDYHYRVNVFSSSALVLRHNRHGLHQVSLPLKFLNNNPVLTGKGGNKWGWGTRLLYLLLILSLLRPIKFFNSNSLSFLRLSCWRRSAHRKDTKHRHNSLLLRLLYYSTSHYQNEYLLQHEKTRT